MSGGTASPRFCGVVDAGVARSSRSALLLGTVAVVCVAGCRPGSGSLPDECRAALPEDSCGPPHPEVDVAHIDTLDDFRTIASALVCERAIACTNARPSLWELGEAYCHPGFARLAALRAGHLDAPFDRRLARAAVEAWMATESCEISFELAQVLRAISEGPVGDPCTGRSECNGAALYPLRLECRGGVCGLPMAGETCSEGCEPGLQCMAGVCEVPAARGEPCEFSSSCRAELVCVEGFCDFLPLGATCSEDTCGTGRLCGAVACEEAVVVGACCEYVTTRMGWSAPTSTPYCDVGECIGHRCTLPRAIGCACAPDGAPCPSDVSVCLAGTCVARPMVGEPCDEAGAACYGSICREGTCARGSTGDPCDYDDDCESGDCRSTMSVSVGTCR